MRTRQIGIISAMLNLWKRRLGGIGRQSDLRGNGMWVPAAGHRGGLLF
jgi:hypothetical protein